MLAGHFHLALSASILSLARSLSFFLSFFLLLTLAQFGYYPDFRRAFVNYNLYDEFGDNVTTHGITHKRQDVFSRCVKITFLSDRLRFPMTALRRDALCCVCPLCRRHHSECVLLSLSARSVGRRSKAMTTPHCAANGYVVQLFQ